MTKFIICAIVKNESKIIERCLKACLPVADAICITDTGSTDNTVELIEKFGKEHNLPTKVPRETFKNFGFNRTQSFLESKKFIEELYGKEELNNWYALLPDADMIFVNIKLKSLTLDKPGYTIVQKNKNLDYYNIRFVRLSNDWKCIGRTHEYWGNCESSKLEPDICYFEDYEDGGCKADKYERDVKLLKEDIEENPKNDRAHFYLAQSYESIDIMKAIEYYIKHNELENASFIYKYMSYYRLGNIYNNFYKQAKADKEIPIKFIDVENLWDTALKYYCLAYVFTNQERAEPYYKIAQHYYDVNKTLSYKYALIAAECGYPKFNTLFIEKHVYSYEASKIVSIQGFYGGDRNISMKHTNLLLVRKDIPLDVINNAYNNLEYYDNIINITSNKKMDKQIISLTKINNEGYLAMNDKSLIILNNDYEIKNVINMNCDIKNPKIFIHNNIIHCLANDSILYKIKGNKLIELKKCEENWLPFSDENNLYFMSKINQIKNYDGNNKYEYKDNELNYDISRFICSAGPIRLNKDKLLVLCNEKNYLHRFIILNNEFKIINLTRTFKFIKKQKTFCYGMTLNSKNEILLAYNVEDLQSFICTINLNEINKMILS